jgi:hypothetical protein
MKPKTALLALAALVFCTTDLLANPASFPVQMSNELPDGFTYGMVIITVLEDHCPGFLHGVKMEVKPNEAVLLPGDNYGVQRFGFNYDGDATELTVHVLNDPRSKWDTDVHGTSSYGPFGVYIMDFSGTGSSRQNPLEIEICSGTDLEQEDLVVRNDPDGDPETDDGCFFVMHIADFTFISQPGYEDIDSAHFSTNDVEVQGETLVHLAKLEAIPGSKRVTTSWTTSSEIDNAGFNIRRAESRNGAYVQINDSMILAEGSPSQGASYEFADEGVRNRKAYWYMLEDIDIYGNSTMHGPVRAMPRLIHLLMNERFVQNPPERGMEGTRILLGIHNARTVVEHKERKQENEG